MTIVVQAVTEGHQGRYHLTATSAVLTFHADRGEMTGALNQHRPAVRVKGQRPKQPKLFAQGRRDQVEGATTQKDWEGFFELKSARPEQTAEAVETDDSS